MRSGLFSRFRALGARSIRSSAIGAGVVATLSDYVIRVADVARDRDGRHVFGCLARVCRPVISCDCRRHYRHLTLMTIATFSSISWFFLKYE